MMADGINGSRVGNWIGKKVKIKIPRSTSTFQKSHYNIPINLNMTWWIKSGEMTTPVYSLSINVHYVLIFPQSFAKVIFVHHINYKLLDFKVALNFST